jgi:hypothetical protein
MPIASRDEVRKLSGNRSAEDIPDSDIDEQISASDTIVNLFTGKTDWTSADMEWPALQQASELLASSWIRQRFKEKDESDKQYREAINLLELINRRSVVAGKREVIIKRRPYRSYPLNQSGSYYSSIHKRFLDQSEEGSATLGPGWFF